MLAVSIFAILRFPPGRLKFVFLALTVSVSLWVSPVTLVRAGPWSDEFLVGLFRLIFFGGGLIVVTLSTFLAAFARPDLLQTKAFRFLQAFNLLVAALAFVPDAYVAGVHRDPLAGPAPLYGAARAFYVAMVLGNGIFFFGLFLRALRASPDDLVRYQMKSIALSFIPGFVLITATNVLYPMLSGRSDYSFLGPYWLLFFVFGIVWTVVMGKKLYLLKQLDEDRDNTAILFEERYGDLVQGIAALKEVLLDRKIDAARMLILNSEENLLIERVRAHADPDAILREGVPPHHIAGMMENYARMERRVSLMNFALLRYENQFLEHGREASRPEGAVRGGDGGSLRFQNPLLVLYHYLSRPDKPFRITDALDVLERDELMDLLADGRIVRRPGAGLALTGEALHQARQASAVPGAG